MAVVSAIFLLLFMAAQGGAITMTALAGAATFGHEHPLAKIGWMALSYVGWVAFTVLLFAVFGADVFIIPMAGAMSAALAVLPYLGIWLIMPSNLKAKLNG